MSARHITIGLLLLATLAGSASAQMVLYVDQDADQPPDGLSWCAAYRALVNCVFRDDPSPAGPRPSGVLGKSV